MKIIINQYLTSLSICIIIRIINIAFIVKWKIRLERVEVDGNSISIKVNVNFAKTTMFLVIVRNVHSEIR